MHAQEKDIRSRSAVSEHTAETLGKDIENLPELLVRKANLEAHTNILQVVF